MPAALHGSAELSVRKRASPLTRTTRSGRRWESTGSPRTASRRRPRLRSYRAVWGRSPSRCKRQRRRDCTRSTCDRSSMPSPGWKTRASSSTSPSLTSSSSSSRRLRLHDSPRAQGWWISLLASESLVARPNPLSREHHLELFLTARAPHGRGIRWVRRDIEMLTGHEARTDLLAAERTRDLVVIERAAIDRDPTPFIDLLHAASLGAWRRRKVARKSRARRRP